MDKSLFHQKIQRTINLGRRGAAASGRSQKLDQLIGADRAAGLFENVQNSLAARRQATGVRRRAMCLAVVRGVILRLTIVQMAGVHVIVISVGLRPGAVHHSAIIA